MSELVQPERLREWDGEKVYRWTQQIIGRDLGQTDWGSPINHVSFDSDSEIAHVIRNLGTGGAVQILSSAGSNLLLANESGVTIPTLIVTTISATTVNAGTVNTTNLVASSAAITTGNLTTLNVSGASALTSLTATTISATGNVTLGDSATLDTHAINGQLTITANLPLLLKNSAGAGAWTLNPTNVGNPVLEFKDASGDNMLLIYPSTSTYAIDVNLGTLATNAARFTGDVLITTDLGVRTVNATTNLAAGAAVSAGTTVSAGTSITAGTSIAATGGISAGASSAFTGGVSVITGGLSVLAGGASITGDETLTGNLVFSGNARRILGDFANGTITNRTLFQTATTNSQTILGILPNGTSQISGLTAYNNSTPTSGTSIGFLTTSTQMRLAVEDAGGGYLPLVIRNGGNVRAVIETDSSIALCATAGSYGGGVGMVYIANRTTGPSSNPSGGGILYAESGALKWRGSGGTTTTVAPA